MAHQAVRQVTVGKRGQNRVVVAQSEVWEKLALTAISQVYLTH